MFLRPHLASQITLLTKQQHRSYIPLKSALSALSALTSYGKPLNYHANQVLHYPKASLYAIVSDIASYPQFVPLIHDAQILARATPRRKPSGSQPPGSGGTNQNSKDEPQQGLQRELQRGLQQEPQLQPQQLPALASLTVGIEALGPWIAPLGIQDSTIRFLSNVYCLPDRGVVEAVAGEERGSKGLSAEELMANGYSSSNATNDGYDSTIKDVGPEWLKVCRTRWQLTELEANKTEVDLRIEIQWKNGVLASATQAVLPGMAERVIEAFERRARDVCEW